MNDLLQQLIRLDEQVMLCLNGLHDAYFDNFMYMYSGKWIWVQMYASILYAAASNFRWKTLAAFVAAVALVITFADQTCASAIRPFVERLRPSNPDNPLSEYIHIVAGKRGGAYGFPSCHAANTFALAVFLMLTFRCRTLSIFMFCWAVLTCYSRIYLGVHYPGDLIAGAVVGSVGALLVYLLLKRVLQLMDEPRLPRPRMKETHAPILVGAVTIGALLIYSSSLSSAG